MTFLKDKAEAQQQSKVVVNGVIVIEKTTQTEPTTDTTTDTTNTHQELLQKNYSDLKPPFQSILMNCPDYKSFNHL
jgi:hypothetical protein